MFNSILHTVKEKITRTYVGRLFLKNIGMIKSWVGAAGENPGTDTPPHH